MTQRKVVLVFTDGADTASRRDLNDVMDQARAKEIMIYAIGLENEDLAERHGAAIDAGSRVEEAGGGNRRRVRSSEEAG